MLSKKEIQAAEDSCDVLVYRDKAPFKLVASPCESIDIPFVLRAKLSTKDNSGNKKMNQILSPSDFIVNFQHIVRDKR
ncbi:hypothetical protein P5673_015684 [Acropora cervicornis]|uniref:Uncharacterized protein n=1 Tax=Acropora cervicornis TaxID=6130 RepID=A0AAD9V588_ACRCE|nr:hypothetical protein P5673_015684 [Acropora cervicornis]